MEVHHHAHTARKKWTHYFWEFLMLFLAVFAGFLAENQREHIVEHQREKKFARRLLSDLRQDSILIGFRIKLLEDRQKAHKNFLEVITSSVKATDSAIMVAFFPLMVATSPDFTTATYNQMKTSGSLRYISDDSLTTSLQKYYEILLPRADRDAEIIDKVFTDHLVTYMTKHFRFQDFNKSEDSVLHTKHVILNRSAESDQELINIMGVYAAGCDNQLESQKPALKKMLELIKLIKKEYHLE